MNAQHGALSGWSLEMVPLVIHFVPAHWNYLFQSVGA